ncbi:MAG TPA: hypothetical protein VLM85_20060 [Polyangiaceae bacterium]|nr:hypothetical protein [Polyangiaceae bacterium]
MSDKRLDDMLSNWPLAPRSQLEWDEAAERVVGALETTQRRDAAGPSDDALLAPPLPKLPEEGQTAKPVRTELEPSARPGSVTPGLAVENKMSKERGRDRSSFQELTKLASIPPTPAPPSVRGGQTPPPSSATPGVLRAEEASSTDSGIVDLKMIAMADPSGEHRAQSTALASEGLFDDDQPPAQPAGPASTATPALASAAPAAASSVPAPAVAQAPAAAVKSAKAAVASQQEKKGGGGIVIVLGTLAAVGAIAAGAFFFVKWQRSHHEAVATTSVSTPAKVEEAKKTPTTPAASASVAQADETEVDDNTVDITNAQPGTKPTAHKRVKAGGAPVASAAPAPPASGAIDPKLVANVPTGPAGGGSGDLAEAMKTAAGGGTGMGQGGDTQQGPKFAPGSVPQRPSQGQVQGAIGSVMPSVKACLGSDDPVSHANVVFQSDGTVKSVSVSGFAAGKPQEACIKSALSKAKVDPFAEASYSIPVSVRP